MDDGGGVFATGDHEDLGVAMCGRIPRVRSMRKWWWPNPGPNGEPVAPSVDGPDRYDTLSEGNDPDIGELLRMGGEARDVLGRVASGCTVLIWLAGMCCAASETHSASEGTPPCRCDRRPMTLAQRARGSGVDVATVHGHGSAHEALRYAMTRRDRRGWPS